MATPKKRVRTIGAEIDSLCREREAIRKAEAKLNDRKNAYEEHWMGIRRRMVDEGMDQARGKLATATVGHREHANIEDYNRFEKYVYRTKSLDLLQSRPSIRAIRERMAEGKTVPGITITHLPKLNLLTRSK